VAPFWDFVMTAGTGLIEAIADSSIGSFPYKGNGGPSGFNGKELTARREACRLGDAVFSRAPNWVGRDFMFVTRS
jgi:hypothetical protein